MKRNTRNEWTKVATRPLFSLYQSNVDMNLYQVRLNASGGYLRRRLRAPSLEEAMNVAPLVAGLERPSHDARIINLADAFSMALENTNRRERSRQDWLKSTEKFLVWLRKRHPLCTHWGMMSRQIVREYLGTYAGKAPNTKRLALQPVLQTARFMHLEFEFPNIGERLGIGTKLKTPPKSVYLTDVAEFCDWLRERDSHLEVAACLQGLAGLQVLEALRLTWTDVDLARGLIQITGEVKNEYRNRVIPVVGRVLEALRRAHSVRLARKVSTARCAEHVVVGALGRSYQDFPSFSRQMGNAIREWNPKCDWAPKDLRNCLPTFSVMEGIHGSIWEQYIGHAPKTITERHYVPRLAGRTLGESNALERQMELFRRFVTEPIEAQLGEETCNFLQLREIAPGVIGFVS